VLAALEAYRLASTKHPACSDGCDKTGYLKMTVIEQNSRKDAKPTA